MSMGKAIFRNRLYTQLTMFGVAVAILAWPCTAWCKEAGLWERYKDTFISADGRVIDYQQSEVSHSEGQGYSMLLALEYGDQEVFRKLWAWTKLNMAVRADGLLAWRWGKRLTGAWGVIDYNNATDGDILVAMALIKAGAKWGDKEMKLSGLALARAVRENLVVSRNGRAYLLPGHFGFDFNGGFSLNPSYMVFSAFRLFASVDAEGAQTWGKIHADAKHLILKSQFGQMAMVADWVAVDEHGDIRLHWEKSPYSGKEAVRVFLYTAFDPPVKSPDGLGSVLRFYQQQDYIPLQMNIMIGEVSLAPAPGGFYAVYAKAAAAAGKDALAKKLFKAARAAIDGEDKNYYSLVLYLLATSEETL
ncbi:MAG: glycosyl hydrolase family 8 [Nitrospinota bacterium]|nr:glycosyl hydrolase family 8 [Nitrospinota bacterium]